MCVCEKREKQKHERKERGTGWYYCCVYFGLSSPSGKRIGIEDAEGLAKGDLSKGKGEVKKQGQK